jgi:hypothetical protein
MLTQPQPHHTLHSLFTIETTYHLPIYRHRTYCAVTLEEACRLAIADQDWRFERRDYDCAGQTYVSGAWRGPDMAYRSPALPVPARFDETVQRKADHFPVLVELLRSYALADDATAQAALAKGLAIISAADDPP